VKEAVMINDRGVENVIGFPVRCGIGEENGIGGVTLKFHFGFSFG